MENKFWSLTDSQLERGYQIITGILANISEELDFEFAHNLILRKHILMWINSDKDKTLMKLRFADELHELERNIDAGTFYIPYISKISR
jgi:hypothetical protein